MEPTTQLRDLVDRPFELLLEMERRAVQRSTSAADAADQWVGVGLRVGQERYVVPREQIREVMKRPDLTRVPGAGPWMLGLANIRGQLIPIIDLKLLCGLEASPGERTARVVMVNSDEVPMGIVVDEVYGFRRFALEDRVEDDAAEDSAGDQEHSTGVDVFSDGVFRREGATWPVLSFFKVVRSQRLLYAG